MDISASKDDFLGRIYDEIVKQQLFPPLAEVLGSYVAPMCDKKPARTSSLSCAKCMAETLDAANLGVIKDKLRMPLRVFESCQEVMIERSFLSSSKHVDIAEKLAIFLLAVGDGKSNRDLQNMFQHSGETISRIFN